ncbi:MAG TPA: HYR domain-containing protein [Verrucomicrobiae bacterium]
MTTNQNCQTSHLPPQRRAGSPRGLPVHLFVAAMLLASNAMLRAQPAEVSVDPGAPPGPAMFPTIQAGLNAVAAGGTVHVAPGIYVEDIVVAKAVSLLGPNAGKAGVDATRGPEAILMPLTDDAANGQIIYVSASGVTIAGFLFNGDNPNLNAGYPVGTGASAAEANTSAAIQNTYFWTTDFAPVDRLRIQNNIIKNIAYDGIYLELALGSDNGFNYVLDNKFETMWEGLQTYAVHSVISNNTFVSINRGLSLHGTITVAPAGFKPLVANNHLTIGEWWPAEIGRLRTEGIWINYRRENAAPLEVSGNVVDTPVAAPAGKTLRGLYALNVDGKGEVTFVGNIVSGRGNCQEGVTAALIAKPGAVSVLGGTLTGIAQAGLMAATKDLDWGTGDVFLTASNVSITMTGGAGALASQDVSTPTSRAQVTVIEDCRITGGVVGVRLAGTNASGVIRDNALSITGNQVGVEVDGARALVQGNNLAGNTQAGIRVMNEGIVDAGDCAGENITGLGSSSGGNDLSGYGFDGTRWTIDNWGTVPVLAYQNNFGAGPGDNIANSVSGPVRYSQNPLVLKSPDAIIVRCVGDIPAATQDYATFRALGGLASAGEVNSVSYVDSPLDPPAGNQDVTRTWTVVDVCGQNGQCEQTIRVQDTTAPTIVAPAAIAVDPDAPQCFATAAGVNLGTPLTADNCGVASVVNNAPAQFATGPTIVTWTVTDINGLKATATQVVTVRDTLPPAIVTPEDMVRPVDPGQNYATVTFNPTANDCSSFSLVASPPSGSHFPPGVNTVDLTATDTAGNISASSFTVTVVEPPVVRLTGYAQTTGVALLSVTGTAGLGYQLQSSADFATWTPLTNSAVPYVYTHTTGGTHRFYRAVYTP